MRRVVETFRHEPIIFGWEVGNELKLNPQGGTHSGDPNLNAFITFMQRAAQEIRGIDSNHLVTSGLISTHHCWMHHEEQKRRLYGGNHFDFMTVHCYNHEYGNDDSGLAAGLNMPFVVEEAGFDTGFKGGDRARLIREDMNYWFNRGASGYMQWGFMATSNDMGDGDGRSGMDRTLHSDWDALFTTYRDRANQLNSQRHAVDLPPKVRPSKPIAFEPGATVYAQTIVNIRTSAGYIDKPDTDLLGYLEQGGSAEISGTSVERDELVWWPIQATLSDGRNVDGWVAQAIPGQVLISTARAQSAVRAAAMMAAA